MQEDILSNFRVALDRFAIGYNKSVVLSSVTQRSLGILDTSMRGIEESLSTIVAAFEEIRATGSSTSENAVRIDEMMSAILVKNASMDSDVVERMDDIERAASDARHIDGLFRELQGKTKSIENVTGAIRDVSDRTNILAINASIEAARAGSVGKGFRIIANEVRNLAGQTGDFAKEIESTIGEFRSSVAVIDERMRGFIELLERFRSSFAEILANFKANAVSIDEAGNFLTQIAAAIQEETKALSEGLGSLEQISANVKDTHAVFSALSSSHAFLDTLLDKGEA
ncbi:MAG TPA: methyl-accepting chemotaxis protein [Rectinemataceae bacterium]|nr:methyl-accepting chemotaxis protein [Rectinemataceae bacterium]